MQDVICTHSVFAYYREFFPLERLVIISVSLLVTLLVDVEIVWSSLVPVFHLEAGHHLDWFLHLLEHFRLLFFILSLLFLLDHRSESFLTTVALFVDGVVTGVILAGVENFTEIVDVDRIITAILVIVVHLTVLVHALTAIFDIIASSVLLVEHQNRSCYTPVQTMTSHAAVGAFVLIRFLPLIPIDILIFIVVTFLFPILVFLLSHIPCP